MTNQTAQSTEEPDVIPETHEVKTLVDLMPTKEQLYFRPADPTASQAFESEPE